MGGDPAPGDAKQLTQARAEGKQPRQSSQPHLQQLERRSGAAGTGPQETGMGKQRSEWTPPMRPPWCRPSIRGSRLEARRAKQQPAASLRGQRHPYDSSSGLSCTRVADPPAPRSCCCPPQPHRRCGKLHGRACWLSSTVARRPSPSGRRALRAHQCWRERSPPGRPTNVGNASGARDTPP